MNKITGHLQPAATGATRSSASQRCKRRCLASQMGAMLVVISGMLVATISLSAIGMTVPVSGPSGDFSDASLRGWKERSFAGNTDYEMVMEQGLRVLKGHTVGKASILYTEQNIDLKNTPIIDWSWKVDRTYEGIDERSRQGDDFPARLYVVAKTGLLPWETLAINYVWSADALLGDSWTNPFTSKAKMVVVQTGVEQVGTWVRQQRDVAADFKTFFDTDITRLNGYAVMVDGDNANKEGTAWFGQIRFSAK